MQLTKFEVVILRLFGKLIGVVYVIYLMVRDIVVTTRAALLGQVLVVNSPGNYDGGPIAIIAAQGGKSIPQSVITAAEALRAEGVSILYVFNGRLTERARAQAAASAWRTLERPNTGRDFGAYKAGALYLMKEGITPERLIFINDSCFFDRNRARPFFRRMLDSTAPLCGPTESHDPTYHLGSFAFSVSRDVQTSKVWCRYWKGYKPSSSRRHAIRYGELGMSLALIKRGGFTPEILYTTADLAPRLRFWTVQDLQKEWLLLPTEIREELAQSNISKMINNPTMPDCFPWDDKNLKNVPNILSQFNSSDYIAAQRFEFEFLLDKILTKIERRSQVHWGGMLFSRHLDMPIFKKDHAYRGLYEINHFIQVMAELSYPDHNEVKQEIAKRGSPHSLKGFRAMLFQMGYI